MTINTEFLQTFLKLFIYSLKIGFFQQKQMAGSKYMAKLKTVAYCVATKSFENLWETPSNTGKCKIEIYYVYIYITMTFRYIIFIFILL